jgi:hypothetical protein
VTEEAVLFFGAGVMMENVAFLESILGKTLRLHTSDTRMFVGRFKCTDNVSRFVSFFWKLMVI